MYAQSYPFNQFDDYIVAEGLRVDSSAWMGEVDSNQLVSIFDASVAVGDCRKNAETAPK